MTAEPRCLVADCEDYGDPSCGEGTCPTWHVDLANHDRHEPVTDVLFVSEQDRDVYECACYRLISPAADGDGWARLRGKAPSMSFRYMQRLLGRRSA